MANPSHDSDDARPAAADGHLSIDAWALVQQQVPIVCVDVVPIDEQGTRYCLILRETADEGHRLCLTGGRIYRNESVARAIRRQLITTLGEAINFQLDEEPQPLYVAQYFPDRRDGHGWDSRKHAVALTFAIQVVGAITPINEALDIEWFAIDGPTPVDRMGFAQHLALQRTLAERSRRVVA
jgi:ADP-ribose pyrophosphatase YjhB (NUDIX family)